MSEVDLLLEVEKHLYSLDDIQPNSHEKECNIFLIIRDIGSAWIVKLRSAGNIFNRREIVLGECIKVDAQIVFKTFTSFVQVMIGGTTMEDEVVRSVIETTGKRDVIDLFSGKCSKRAHNQALNTFDALAASAGTGSGSFASAANGHPLGPRTLTTTGAAAETRDRLASKDVDGPLGSGIIHQVNHNHPNSVNPNIHEQPLKKGWLLKKRDIISGWKCRYFEVFPGRLDYYSDQNDKEPRGSVSLIDADISTVKAVTVKRVHEYWGLTVETKNPDKCLRLASERTGLEGMVEASTWHQVFTIASQHRGGVPIATSSAASKGSGPVANTTNPNKGQASNAVIGTATVIPSTGSKATNVGNAANAGTASHTAPTTAATSVTAATSSSGTGKHIATTGSSASANNAQKANENENTASERSSASPLSGKMPYAAIIVVLAIIVHYSWSVSEVISTKVYLTLIAMVLVLLAIFLQELLSTSKANTAATGGKASKNRSHQSSAAATPTPTSSAIPTPIPPSNPSSPVGVLKKGSKTSSGGGNKVSFADAPAPPASANASSSTAGASTLPVNTSASRPATLMTTTSFSVPALATSSAAGTGSTSTGPSSEDGTASSVPANPAMVNPAETSSLNTAAAVYGESGSDDGGEQPLSEESDDEEDIFVNRPTFSEMPDSDDEN